MSSRSKNLHFRPGEHERANGKEHCFEWVGVAGWSVGAKLVSRNAWLSAELLADRFFRGDPLPKEVTREKPNLILAADCVYFEPAFPLLLATLQDLLELCNEAVIYFCFKKRRRADMQFMKNARKKFLVEEIEDVEREKFSREGLFLYTFRRKPWSHTVLTLHSDTKRQELYSNIGFAYFNLPNYCPNWPQARKLALWHYGVRTREYPQLLAPAS